MSGRPRRGKAAASNADQVHYIQETSLFRAPPSRSIPEDDWPDFELRDAVILNKDGVSFQNPLHVLLNGPLLVRGYLHLDKDGPTLDGQKSLLLRKIHRAGEPIEISNCSMISIGEGQIEEGQGIGDPMLWVRGRSAWFQIYPSPQFAPIWRNVSKSIQLYYGILSRYEATMDRGGKIRPRMIEGRKTTTGVERLQELFVEYAIKVGNGMTVEEVQEHCAEAAPLFLHWVLTGKDSHVWEATYFKKWMMKEHADLAKRTKDTILELQNRSLASTSVEMPTRTRTKSRTPINHEEPDETTSRKRATRSGSTAPSPQPRPQSLDRTLAPEEFERGAAQDQPMVDTSTESQEPFDSLLEALEEAHPQLNTRKGVALTTLASKLYFDYRWPTFKNGAPGSHKIPILEVLHYNAPALLATLDSKKWQGEFWDWLNQVSKVKLKLEALKPSDLPWKVLRRKKIARTSTAKFPPLTSPIIATPDDEDQDEANEFETPRRLGKGVKTPARQGKSTLRPVASAHKRDYEDMDDDSDEESPVTKRAHHDAAHDVVREYKAGSSDEEEEIKLVIRADKLPSDVPQGKDGTWSCAEDDCDYVVRGGDAESCQQHIEAHFKDHEKQGERVQLAVTEGTRGHLPINHLLEKIQKLGEKAEAREERQQALDFDGQIPPKPIKRKLLV